ncbi:class I SAM-dependent methyltransferase [Methanocaldococcus fervens]|uniref:Methyltransferase type 11 n=1 Tax=Methanocaldococcus fervens (strain DSM 4213 / JCM 15782 / AG86) TaxID=573064 RepID=C7P708_METFA|nr:class I SAM-dependent methyltransferase [Methanocaldococcus fervens]ACV24340.1 Methyltransferase type 11 [Methanocaldococcus fervens AG86]
MKNNNKNRFPKKYHENYVGVIPDIENTYPKEFFEYIKKLPKGAKILDIGCAAGGFFVALSKIRNDLEFYGIDIADVEELLPKDLNIKFYRVNVDEEPLPFPDDYFDLVHTQQVFEHLYYPQRAMSEIKRVLKKDGLLYIGVPSTLRIFLPGNLNFWQDYTHVRPFNRASLRRLIEENGLKVIKLSRMRNRKSVKIFWYLIFVDFWTFVHNVIGVNLQALAKK